MGLWVVGGRGPWLSALALGSWHMQQPCLPCPGSCTWQGGFERIGGSYQDPLERNPQNDPSTTSGEHRGILGGSTFGSIRQSRLLQDPAGIWVQDLGGGLNTQTDICKSTSCNPKLALQSPSKNREPIGECFEI